jgi:hypothetical protein
MNYRTFALIAALTFGATLPAHAGAPPFSYMTLNDTTQIAITVDDIERELAVYGLNPQQVRDTVTAKLVASGIEVVPYDTALIGPKAGLLRVRVLTNRDGQGFYHLSVKLELRQKIALGNSAGGFISQVVWSDAQNGVMLASEVEKVAALLDEVMGHFLTDYRAQNSRVDH